MSAYSSYKITAVSVFDYDRISYNCLLARRLVMFINKNQLFALLAFMISGAIFSGFSSSHAKTSLEETTSRHTYAISADLEAADAPGQPAAGDGYTPPKKWDGKKVRNPNGNGAGWPDAKGDVWVPTGSGGDAHGGPHWDVQTPGGKYRNVYPGGKIR